MEHPCDSLDTPMDVNDAFDVFACLNSNDQIIWLQNNTEGLLEDAPPATVRVACLTVQVIDDDTMWTLGPTGPEEN